MKSSSGFKYLVDIFLKKYRDKNFADILIILGAGASFCSGMSPWGNLKEKILNTAADCYKDPKEFEEHAWKKIRALVGKKEELKGLKKDVHQHLLENSSVEMICNIACESDVVGKKIRELFRKKYSSPSNWVGSPPQLAYEIIAHFIKNKIIDNAISFNFDEVLDISMNNELGSGGYDLILSDQQVLPDQFPDKPRLIKIHGSISHPQTLRFKIDDTQVMSQELINLLDNTLIIKERKVNKKIKNKKFHIVSLGYSWNDRDFASYVTSRSSNISSISIIKIDNKIPKFLEDQLNKKTKLNIISTQELTNNVARFHGYTSMISIDQFLWALWNELERKFLKEDLPYIPISRHLILGHLFGPDSEPPGFLADDFIKRPKFLNDNTSEKRFIAEIYLHLIKCKGMVNASNMALDPRLHYYYKAARTDNRCKIESLNQIPALVQSQFPDVKETYFAKAHMLKELIDGFKNMDNFTKKESVYVPKFDISSKKISLTPTNADQFLEENLTKIFNGPEVEIISGLDARALWVFRNPIELSDHLSIQNKTKELLNSNWSHLFVVAESGAWLFDDNLFKIFNRIKDKNKRKNILRTVFLIRSSPYGTDEWYLHKVIIKKLEAKVTKKLPSSIRLISMELPWWEHNRHLSLAYNSEKNSFIGGIYFRRRLKTSRISPVFVENKADCVELYFTFLSYYRRVITDPYRLNKNCLSEFSEITEKLYNVGNKIKKMIKEENAKIRLEELISKL